MNELPKTWLPGALAVLPLYPLIGVTASDYARAAACAKCHPAQFAAQSSSAHARALAPSKLSQPGLWAFGVTQMNVQIPTNVSTGDLPIQVSVGGEQQPKRCDRVRAVKTSRQQTGGRRDINDFRGPSPPGIESALPPRRLRGSVGRHTIPDYRRLGLRRVASSDQVLR